MIDEMLTFLARAPTLGDLSLTWGQAGPRLGTGGVYLRGVKARKAAIKIKKSNRPKPLTHDLTAVHDRNKRMFIQRMYEQP